MAPARFPIDHLIGDRSCDEIAADLAMTTRSVQRWITKGLNWQQADVFACRILHLHPATVFGEEWYEVAAAEARPDPAPIDPPRPPA